MDISVDVTDNSQQDQVTPQPELAVDDVKKKVVRTPSGCIISNLASNTRLLFSPRNDKHVNDNHAHVSASLACETSPSRTSEQTTDTLATLSPLPQRHSHASARLTRQRIKQLKDKLKSSDVLSADSDTEVISTPPRKRKQSTSSLVSDQSSSDSLADQSDNYELRGSASNTFDEIGIPSAIVTELQLEATSKRAKFDKEYKMEKIYDILLKASQTETHSEELQDELNEQVEVIDIKTVMNMFQRLSVEIKQGATATVDMSTLEIKKDEELQHTFEHYDDKIEKIQRFAEKMERKVEIISQTMIYNQQVTEDIVKRLDAVEMSIAKKAAILTGLNLTRKKSTLIDELKELFNDVLNTEAEIEDAYQLGEKVPAPVVIIFTTATEKRTVFSNKNKLATIKGHNNQDVYLNDYLPASVNEAKRRDRDIIKLAKAQHPGEDIKPEYVKGAIKIKGQVYKKAVIAPKPSDLLDLTSDELDKLLKVHTSRGNEIKKDGNRFVAYGLDVTNHQQIREAYLKLRLLHPKARHIVCAYYLPQTGPQYQDYCDDQEVSAGRIILKNLVENDLINKAVFVVRYCGEKLGQDRFDLYTQAMKWLMDKHPYNQIRKQQQKMESLPMQKSGRSLRTSQPSDATDHTPTPSPTPAPAPTQPANKNEHQAFAKLFKQTNKTVAGHRGRGRGRPTGKNSNTERKPYVLKNTQKSDEHNRIEDEMHLD